MVCFLVCLFPPATAQAWVGRNENEMNEFNVITVTTEILSRLARELPSFYRHAVDAYFWDADLKENDRNKDGVLSEEGTVKARL